MHVKVLGPGCARCKRLEELTREAALEAGVSVEIEHVTDTDRILDYPIVSTPGLVIEEKVRMSGRLPRREEIVAWLRETAGQAEAAKGASTTG
ncbi:small redox-active disulfide protein 2 [Skermanella aerolata]|jgi:small redox-active disulfide protein 2|uniref:Redox-active disulfide protein 2 n=1 Tax=Skermanella aerolata TaxID=393310 RepID=A0A512DXV8_9PROT|nr:thioredoxin family protein [Skermanella aerolata]KJB93865.1 redox-active disulfide protein 2 [Skermanella aerolata KACC 11604]GEO41312.1 redox-active disulfide protein 2 [Skermanella aerolata]